MVEENIMYSLIILVVLYFSTCCTTIVAQTAEADVRIAGIKYVAPLNNVAGQNIEDEDGKFQCYRCNRYKGGGAACPETKREIDPNSVSADAYPAETIVVGCEVCLKVFTTTYFRNKNYIADKFNPFQDGNHFEPLHVTSRACIQDKKDSRLLDGCITDTSAGGTIERCYCQGNLCNDSTTISASLKLMTVSVLIMVFAVFL
ncbi:uncharacterized protein [Watersipora subatra]|uniref:uncharacterized protein n=1 Tax=Watersipora subatra TaxID=2589382 RepID=UPI00355C34BA